MSEALSSKTVTSPSKEFQVVLTARVELDIDRAWPSSTMRKYVAGQAAVARQPLEAAVTSNGGTIVARLEGSPQIIAKLRGDRIAHVARSFGVAEIREDQREFIKGSVQSSNDLNIPAVFHNSNFSGTGIRLGLSGEATGSEAGCRLFDAHPAYQFTAISYSNSASISCTSDADCSVACSNGRCNSGVCAVGHGHWVSGMMGGTYAGVDAGALNAQLFVANSDWSHAQQLDWFGCRTSQIRAAA